MNTMWSIDDFFPENGSTVFYPGSHRWERDFRPNLFVTTMAIPGTKGEEVPDYDDPAVVDVTDVIPAQGSSWTLVAAPGGTDASTDEKVTTP